MATNEIKEGSRSPNQNPWHEIRSLALDWHEEKGLSQQEVWSLSIYHESVKFNNDLYAEEKPTQICDFNNNGILELMVKFDRSSVIKLLELEELDEVSVSGKLSDGITFEGTCELAYL